MLFRILMWSVLHNASPDHVHRKKNSRIFAIHHFIWNFQSLASYLLQTFGFISSQVGPDQWWRYQMETFSALLALCEGNSQVTGEFPSQRPVTQSFDVLFDLRLNKRLNKPPRRRWFETSSRSLWRHCNAMALRRVPRLKCVRKINSWDRSTLIALIVIEENPFSFSIINLPHRRQE